MKDCLFDCPFVLTLPFANTAPNVARAARGLMFADSRGIRRAVVDDPSQFCSAWLPSPPSVNASPIWRVQPASRRPAAIALHPVYPVRCSGWHGTDWRGIWTRTGNASQCTEANHGPAWCLLAVRRAWVAPSGLVFTGSYRFNLGMSHIGIDAQWAREADTPPSRRSETSVTFRVVYSFRQQFAGNPTHSIIQTLPLLAMALPFVKRDDAHVLAHSPMFAALARQVLPADRVVLSSDWVWADRIHLVVVRPPFAVMQHVFPSGVLLVLRPVPPPQLTASRETLLYLARSSQAHRASRGGSTARVGVRSFDNEAEVLSRTGAGLRSAQNVRSLKLEVFDRFHTLRRQAQAFGRARIIAGPEGTAWSGVAFARQGVALVQWCGIRDGWSLAEYFGLGAAYYQLHPHWRVDPAVPSCAATGHIDECPWHLTPADLGVWDQLLAELLRDQGAALRRAGHVAPRIARAAAEQARVKRLQLQRAHSSS